MNFKRLKTRNFLLMSIIFHIALAIFLVVKVPEYYREIKGYEMVEVDIVERQPTQKTDVEVAQKISTIQPSKFEIQSTIERFLPQNRTISVRTSPAALSKTPDMDILGASQAPSASANRAATLTPMRSTRSTANPSTESFVPESQLSIDLKPDNSSRLFSGVKLARSGDGNASVASQGRSSFGSETGARGTGQGPGGRGSGGAGGVSSLISPLGLGASESGGVLADVAQSVVLGGDVPPLAKGEPGGIIIGSGKDFKGRLHLVKLDDPLDPAADF